MISGERGGHMIEEKRTSLLEQFGPISYKKIDRLLQNQVKKDKHKIIVLDDDSTGVQTVHDVSVYTDWSLESIREGFQEKNKLFFILTNSRGLSIEQTTIVHRQIALHITQISEELNIPYFIISRSDSTLRGHYPLETELLKEVWEKQNNSKIDGEILCPFFKEGGRFTINNTHYVQYGERLVPVGKTEFAKDKTFGYKASNLCEYVEEKTEGRYLAKDVVCIPIECLRNMEIDAIVNRLIEVQEYEKVVVNAVDEYDVKVFCIALYQALERGKHFLYRTAAGFVKAVADVSDKSLLTQKEMVGEARRHGGIIIIGSHTDKTTRQLDDLRKIPDICFIEMNSDLVLTDGMLEKEVHKIIEKTQNSIMHGITVVVSTKRRLLTVANDTKKDALERSVKISDALQKVVGELTVTPAFVIAKGGITSSDVGTKALKVKRATVLGQAAPGVPVWKTGKESKFPYIPYIIFPGNVGDDDTLRKVVEELLK